VKRFSFKRRFMAATVAILLVLFLVRPGASRLKARITNAISRSVERPADVGSVHIRFLPRPGFDLENVVIYEDPTFGAEPMLRAPEVTAVVRLTSLLRGRLDISRLELTEPSLNLVRRADGRWNWNMLLERTARTPLAPTAKSKSETRLGFPYIEASSGRINFKMGSEKKPYALLNADFSVWQESENAWGIRLKAEPLRTDMNLSDAGSVRMSGAWQRAASLRETPLQINMEWQHAQLGQLTKLIYGDDKGWRGDVQMQAALSGTPAAMQVTTDASVRDFHRYDILVSDGLRLAAHCEGKYSSVDSMLRQIFCVAPIGQGAITLKGDTSLPGSRGVDLSLNLENMPANAVAQLARHAKKYLPPDLVAAGVVQGNFKVSQTTTGLRAADFEGHGEFTNLRLQSIGDEMEVAPSTVPFVLSSGSNPRASVRSSSQARTGSNSGFENSKPLEDLRIEFGPFPVAMGRSAPALVRGWVSQSAYEVEIKGDAEVSRTLRMANLLGVQAITANVEGIALLDLQIAGPWTGSPQGAQAGSLSPRVNGTAQLRNLEATVTGLNGPIEISSAKLRLVNDKARLDDIRAEAGGAQWSGWVELPRGCGTPGACVDSFNLQAEDWEVSDLQAWLSSHADQRHWYQVLSPQQAGATSILQKLRAAGKLNVTQLRIRDVVAQQVSASIDMEHGKIKVTNLSANLLGGKHRGDWQIDFAAAMPAYTGTGTLTDVSLEQLAGAVHDPWISGTINGTYQLKASGESASAFWKSLTGGIRFDLGDGTLSHISLTTNDPPLQIVRWQGNAGVHDGEFEVEKSKLISTAETYDVSGTASFSRSLNFELSAATETGTTPAAPRSTVYIVTGSVAEPQVKSITTSETQARLKP
jgi:hypothetical protein